jgi:hypothetical protein
MTSLAKIKVSRANGRKSRGPRSAKGKVKSRMNAARHGLAAITSKNPDIFAEIEPIAIALCNGATHPLLFEQALIIAENAFVLRCVQAEYIAAIERHRDITVTPLTTGDLGFARAKATLARAKLTYEMLVKREVQAPAAESAGATDEPNIGSSQERETATKECVGGVKPALERRGNAVEDLHQPAYSPGSFYDSVRVGLARRDEGVENFGVTRTIGCLIRIIDTQARK